MKCPHSENKCKNIYIHSFQLLSCCSIKTLNSLITHLQYKSVSLVQFAHLSDQFMTMKMRSDLKKKQKNPTAKLSYKSFWARQASAQKLLIDFSSRNYQQFCICVSVISSFITFSKDKSHLTALLFSCAHIFLPFNKAELKLEIGRHFLSNCHLTVWCWANNRDKIIEMF